MTVTHLHPQEHVPTDAEVQVVAAAIIDGAKALDTAGLDPDDFHDHRLGHLYGLLCAMNEEQTGIDFVTLMERLRVNPIRGLDMGAVTAIAGQLVSGGNVGYHADIVRAAAASRKVTAVATRMLQGVHEARDPAVIVEDALVWLDKIATVNVGVQSRTMGDAVDEAIARVKHPERHVPTPWPALNQRIGGWRPGRVYVIGARPGNGKSIMGLNAAQYHCRRTGKAVAVTSLEMDRPELTQRGLAAGAQIDFHDLQGDNLTPEQWARIHDAAGELRRLPIYVDDRTSQRPAGVRAFAKNLARRHDLAMVVVDYLQLMDIDGTDNRQQEVARFSRAMKLLARDLNVPVLVLSQLNRQSESRGGTPRMSDLRDSGALEQDADVVLLLHREHGQDPDQPQLLTVVVGKNRQGPTGAFDLLWQGATMTIGDW